MLSMNDRSIGTSSHEPQERSRTAPDHSPEVDTRIGLTREAALLEMEKFLDISEYEIRKVMGQGSPLPQSNGPDQAIQVPAEHAQDHSEALANEKRAMTETVDSPQQEPAPSIHPSTLEQAPPAEN